MIRLISLDVTSRCNLNCAHCYNRSGGSGDGDLSEAELLSLAAEIRNIHPENVCLCGGEPLLAPNLVKVLGALQDRAVSVSMVSNGLLITPELAEMLVSGGLHAIQISLDGAYAWQHDSLRGRAGSFDAACRAAKAMRDAGIAQLSVDMIPNRLNFRGLEEYFALCAGLHVDVVRFMPFMPLGRGAESGSLLTLSEEEMFSFQRELCRLKEQYAGRFITEWDDPVLSARYLCRRIERGDMPFSVCITSKGDVNTDVYAPVTLGNIRERPLQEILDSGLQAARNTGRFREILSRLHEINQLADVRPVSDGR